MFPLTLRSRPLTSHPNLLPWSLLNYRPPWGPRAAGSVGRPQEAQGPQSVLGRGGSVHTQCPPGLPTHSRSLTSLPPLAWVDTCGSVQFSSVLRLQRVCQLRTPAARSVSLASAQRWALEDQAVRSLHSSKAGPPLCSMARPGFSKGPGHQGRGSVVPLLLDALDGERQLWTR